jgi:hypothetical protein
MSKKTFANGLNSLLGEATPQPQEEARKKGRPVFTTDKPTGKTSEAGCHEGETRATFILSEELLDKLKAVAYWKRALIKEVLVEALEGYLTAEEVKPRPERERKKEQAAAQKRLKQEGAKARLPQY